ncbi:hypothetical protein CF326_g5142 [Tilletia indica]|nr:hypothetical protein CF326_g5142 [Tilletia indica]
MGPNSPERTHPPQDWIHLRHGPLALRGSQCSNGPAYPYRRVPATRSGQSTCEAEVFALATGPNTFFGRAASLVDESNHEADHPRHSLVKIGLHSLSPDPIFVIALMVVQRAALVLIVEGILPAMPTVLAVSLAIGAEQSPKRNALGTHTAPIKKMPAVTIPYSDKTRTVNTNKITIDLETVKLSSQRPSSPTIRSSSSPCKRLERNTNTTVSIRCRGYLAQLRRARDSMVSPTDRLLDTSSHLIEEKEDIRVPSVKIASSAPVAYVELFEYLFDGTIKRMSSVYRPTPYYSHSSDNVARFYFVKDAAERALLACSNTFFSSEDTKDIEAAMLPIREIDERMEEGTLSHMETIGEQVPSNSCPCSTLRGGDVHFTSASAIGVRVWSSNDRTSSFRYFI